jgi:uncharacterized protein (DUF58 family)
VLTERGLGVLAAAGGLWLASRSFGIPELQMAAVACLALVALAWLFTRLTSTRLEVDRSVRPGRLFHDAEGVVELQLTNTGRLPTATMEVRDRVPATLADRTSVLVPAMSPGLRGRTTVRYRVRGAHRGRFQLGPLEVRLRDPFGLVARRKALPGSSQLVVYPPVWQLPGGVPLGGTTTTGGEGRARPLPSGEELANVREYVRGDDLRTVHWASTAHRGKLMVRQAEAPQDPRSLVLVDVREDRHEGSGPASSFETVMAVAASAIYHLASRGRQVALVDRPVASAPRGLGWEEWLERLAAASPARVDLAALLAQVGRGTAGDGALVAIVTVPDPTELRALVRAGRAFPSKLCVLVDAASHAGRGRRSAGANATVAALRAAGWRVTLVAAGDRLDERWAELLHHRRATAAVGS